VAIHPVIPPLNITLPTKEALTPQNGLVRIAFVASAVPRRCGIATFTADVMAAVKAADPTVRCSVVAIDEPNSARAYGPEVKARVRQRDPESYRAAAAPLGWLAVGMVPISALYGALVGLVGTHMPQYSTKASKGISPRTAQSMITFGTIGLVMLVLGLAALGLIPDPLAAVSRRFRNAPLVLMGVLIGAFLIGRPYPLFRDMFRHAAKTHNPLYGATAFALQSIGNIIVMALIFLLLSWGLGGRIQRWLAAKPGRTSVVTAAAFVVAGAFTMVYWDVRVLGRLGYIWFPTPPWK